jgi:hypothetical protein
MALDPRTAALNPSAVIAANQSSRKFIPKKDGFVVVQLPGESMRCEVVKVMDEDTVYVRIGQPPISRTHTMRMNDIIGVRRRLKAGMPDTWEGQRDDDFIAEQKRISDAARTTRAKAVPPPSPPVAQKPQKAAPAKQAAKKTTKAKAPAKRKTASKGR